MPAATRACICCRAGSAGWDPPTSAVLVVCTGAYLLRVDRRRCAAFVLGGLPFLVRSPSRVRPERGSGRRYRRRIPPTCGKLLVGEPARTVDQPRARPGLVLAGAGARLRERGGGVAKPALPRPDTAVTGRRAHDPGGGQVVRLVGRPDLGVTSGSGQHALLLPHRPGNNQIGSLQNVVEQPRVGLLFFVPGMNETLRARATVGARQAADFRSCASPWKRRSGTGADRSRQHSHLPAGARGPDCGSGRRTDRRIRGPGEPQSALLPPPLPSLEATAALTAQINPKPAQCRPGSIRTPPRGP